MATPASPVTRPGGEVGTIGTPGMWIIGGLIVAWLAGFIGGVFFDSGEDSQAVFFSIGALAGTAAGTLLAIRHVRAGLDLSAAGFAVFAILGVAGSVFGYTGEAAEIVFASLALLHLVAFALIAAQAWSPIWARGAVALSGIVFAIYGYDYILGDFGEKAPDPDSALLVIGYLLLAVAIAGWVMTLRDEGEGAWMPTGGTRSAP